MIGKLKKTTKDALIFIRDFVSSLYINFRVLPLKQAMRMPIQIKWNTKIQNISKGSIEIDADIIAHNMIRIGYRGGKFLHSGKTYIDIVNGGKAIFKGTATVADGASLFIDGGKVIFGSNFYSNCNMQIHCEKSIQFGNDLLMGWNVSLRDNDGHSVYIDGEIKSVIGDIKIGDHVWIASDVTILKNTTISDNSLVACNSVVCGLKMENTNCLVAGIPAKIKKENVSWQE